MNKFYKKQFIEFIWMHIKGFRQDFETLFNELNLSYDQEQILKKSQEEILLFSEHILLNIRILDVENNDTTKKLYKENLLNFISYTSGYYIKNYQILFDSITKTEEQKKNFTILENALIYFIYLIYTNIKIM